MQKNQLQSSENRVQTQLRAAQPPTQDLRATPALLNQTARNDQHDRTISNNIKQHQTTLKQHQTISNNEYQTIRNNIKQNQTISKHDMSK